MWWIEQGGDGGLCGGAEMGANLPAVDLGSARPATAITAGRLHTCALLDDGSIKCWGYSEQGQLGYEDNSDRGDGINEMGANLSAVDLGSARPATAIAAGRLHTCAVLDDGSVKCWGSNYGELGYGDTSYRGDHSTEMGAKLPAVDLGSNRSAVVITAGSHHTCAVLDDGSVKCWGKNEYGQLGYGDTSSRGNGIDEMGDNLPAVDLGSGISAVAVYAFELRTCAVLDDGSVKCWGKNEYGQLGYGDTSNRGDQINGSPPARWICTCHAWWFRGGGCGGWDRAVTDACAGAQRWGRTFRRSTWHRGQLHVRQARFGLLRKVHARTAPPEATFIPRCRCVMHHALPA
ncbi:regulator of chromosome condensation 1/beta-lactamase-inhibitor protein II [Baffinella frigidus]|nr:regulator of chromosome condensation 1/beta-lactamase-inhibitor protein II [Cryptophyta sp. CCMP2293]